MTERRWDPTAGEWVTFATHRQDRTYQPPAGTCPLCPTRPGGPVTEIPHPDFEVAVFDNRFPSYAPDPPAPAVEASELYPVAPADGRCEVVVYAADHDLSFGALPAARARMLVDVWADRWEILAAVPAVAYVLVFENRGEVIGTTLSHPHGQIYGYPFVPPRPARELLAARAHLAQTGRCVECDVVAAEVADACRVVATDGDWVAWVPFWARFPYEVHLAPRAHHPTLSGVGPAGRDSLARALQVVTRAYDALWGFPLPYVMAFHQRPCPGRAGRDEQSRWDQTSHLHVELEPPHRASDRLKHLAGSELEGGAFVTDVAPEAAAEQLRAAVARSR